MGEENVLRHFQITVMQKVLFCLVILIKSGHTT